MLPWPPPLRAALAGLRDDVADVVLSRACMGCCEPGAVLCVPCWQSMVRVHQPSVAEWPASVPVLAAARYEGTLRRLVNAHKERGLLALGPGLGGLLAVSALAVTHGPAAHLVPVPPHASSVRRRGVDSLALLVAHAVRHARAAGVEATSVPMLRRHRDLGRQVGRAVVDRDAAVHGAMHVVGRPSRPATVIVVDDVITSGATLREAIRALQEAGVEVAGAAAIAATPRRSGQVGQPQVQAADDRVDAR